MSEIKISPRRIALIAGFAYLMIFIFGLSFGVIENFIVSGDATTTANNIMASESLFRLGIVGLIIVLVADAVVAWALYIFFKPVSKSVSLLTAWLRLLYTALFGIILINLFSVLELLSGADYLKVFEPNQLYSQAMIFLTTYQYGFNIAYIFFGLHILGLGYLILKSDNIPKFLGIFLMIAFVGYMIDSFGSIFSTSYASNPMFFIIFIAVPAIIAELSLTIWLLWRGGKQNQLSPEEK